MTGIYETISLTSRLSRAKNERDHLQAAINRTCSGIEAPVLGRIEVCLMGWQRTWERDLFENGVTQFKAAIYTTGPGRETTNIDLYLEMHILGDRVSHLVLALNNKETGEHMEWPHRVVEEVGTTALNSTVEYYQDKDEQRKLTILLAERALLG